MLAGCQGIDPTQANSTAYTYTQNLTAGRLMQALFQVERAASGEGWTVARHEQAADLWDQVGDLSRAVPHWMAAARQQPSPTGLRRLASALLRLQRWADAETTLDQLIVIAPGDSWATYQRGILLAPVDPTAAVDLLRRAGGDVNFSSAAQELIALLEAGSRPPEAAMQLGLWLAGRELWPQAERAFDQASALDGTFAEAIAYRGLARDHQQKEAGADFQQALMLAPGSAHVQFLYGLHLRLNDQKAASLSAFVAAARLDPTNPAYAAELGAAYEVVGNLLEARAWFLRAIDVAGGDARFQQLLDRFDARHPVNS
jgi:tetratricopeptide (TPR) repeat protein